MEHTYVSNVERKMDVKIFTILLLFTNSFISNAQSLEFKHSGQNFNFWESLPENYDSNKKYPLIIFLHGRGERGDGTDDSADNMLTWGPLRHIKNGRFNSFDYQGKEYAFIVIAPQLNKPQSIWEPDFVDQVINYALLNYAVDASRVYLTGLSMGGNGTWVYAYSDFNSQNKLAAIVPIASWGDTNKACRIASREIPVWAFHGVDDNVISFDRGRSIYEAAKSCTQNNYPEINFTAYQDTKHDSWKKAYDVRNEFHTPNVYQWMLSHTLPAKNASKIVQSAKKRTILSDINVKNSETQNSMSLELICKLPSSLEESSGMVTDSKGNIWMHNDSGKGPFIFKLDTAGNVLDFKKIIHASNFDWEDLAIDKNDNLYIGDIGNNENKRKKLMIYKVNLNDTSSRLYASTIGFTYEDQVDFPPAPNNMNFDAESLIFMNGFLYLFTKNRTEPFDGMVKVYKIPSTAGDYSAKLIDTLRLGNGDGGMIDNWITAADIDKTNKHLTLLSHSKLWLISCFKNDQFSSGVIQEVPLKSFSQKESICFNSTHELFISDENYRNILGGNLYKIQVKKILNDCNNYYEH